MNVARARRGRAARAADVLRPPRRARGVRRAPTSSCSAASCSSRRSPRRATGRPAWARVKAWLPEGTWVDVFTGRPTPAAARSTCTATWPRSRCWPGPARSCRWSRPTDARRRHRPAVARRGAGVRRRRRRVHARRGPRRRPLGPHPDDLRRREPASSPCTTSRATLARCRTTGPTTR